MLKVVYDVSFIIEKIFPKIKKMKSVDLVVLFMYDRWLYKLSTHSLKKSRTQNFQMDM